MTSSIQLIVNFEDILYEININKEDTVIDLKNLIYINTDVKPSRQTFPDLFLSGNLQQNNCKLYELNLKFDEVLKVKDKFGGLHLVLQSKLKIEWQDTLFLLMVEPRDTVLDLKCMISKATGLKPLQQKFANFDFPAYMNENDYELQQLGLKPWFILQVIDRAEEDVENYLRKLKIEWENIYFSINIEKEDTIVDIKLFIFLATDVEPPEQIFVNLTLPDNIREDRFQFWQLGLKSDFILKVVSRIKTFPTYNSINASINWSHIYSQSNLVVNLIKGFNEAPQSVSNGSNFEHQSYNEVEDNNEYRAFSKPRSGKKLVVLDIDRTIFDYSSSNLYCAARPFLEVFLKGIYEDFDIGIWSATNMNTVVAKLCALGMLDNPSYKVLFCMSVDGMVPATVDQRLCRVKPLQNVWDIYPQYNYHNTTICDDQYVNFFYNKKNGILVEPYYSQNHGVDNELLRLLSYLKFIAPCKDLTIIDHEKWRTHGDWDSDSCSEDENSNTSSTEERSSGEICQNDETK